MLHQELFLIALASLSQHPLIFFLTTLLFFLFFFLLVSNAPPLSQHNTLMWGSQMSAGTLNVWKKIRPCAYAYVHAKTTIQSVLIYMDVVYAFRYSVFVVQLCMVWQGHPNVWIVQKMFW